MALWNAMFSYEITGVPVEGKDSTVTVTIASTARDVVLPRKAVDFTPGYVLVPAWLCRKMRRYLGAYQGATCRRAR